MKKQNLTILSIIRKHFIDLKNQLTYCQVDLDQIVVSYKSEHNDEGFKHFIGYLEKGIAKPLCIILPQMSGFIKYFENRSKNMTFFIKDDEVWDKWGKILDVIN